MTNSNDALRAAAPDDLGKCVFCGYDLRWQTDDIDGWIAHLYCVGCDFLGPISDLKYDDVEDAKGDSWVRWTKGLAALSRPSPVAGGGLREAIILTAAEKQSGFDRVKWAEGLIRQLPDTHEGRNSWLLNYGRSDEADERRQAYNAGRTARGLPLAEYAALNQPAAPVEAVDDEPPIIEQVYLAQGINPDRGPPWHWYVVGPEGEVAYCQTDGGEGHANMIAAALNDRVHILREDLKAHPPEPAASTVAQELWRHKKRGTAYEKIGCAILQAATCDVHEGDGLVIYRGEDGKLWARLADEFHDGRFEFVSATHHKGSSDGQ